MLSINTNLSSLIAQNSLKMSSFSLNQAVERMTTGYKINHAKDNAANYSIATNMTTKIGSYMVAEDNVAMGMDLVTTAMDIVSNMQDKATRLRALSTQARNGTFGAQSLSAINTEAAAIMAEINRLYSTAEYNDISLFNRKAYEIAPHLPQAGESGFIDETAFIATTSADSAPTAKAEYNGFIADPEQRNVDHLDSVSSIDPALGFTKSEYKIAEVADLVALAKLVNDDGLDATGVTFVLAKDLDIGAYCDANMATGGWTPIGINPGTPFSGTFDGNGHVIKNLKIDRETDHYQGLFGFAYGEFKNIGVVNAEVKGLSCVGGLVGNSEFSSISNSYATGNVTGTEDVGGLVGNSASSLISNSYATGNVTGTDSVGGLVGSSYLSLTFMDSSISNSYATGNVTGTDSVGGLVGKSSSSPISNSYATGNVSGRWYVGGLAGASYSLISNSYATGNLSGRRYVGGLAGYSNSSITNSYATGNLSGQGMYVGGLAGYSNTSSISNSYATGNVTGKDSVGGLVGYSTSNSSITNSYATGSVSGDSFVGGLVGQVYSTSGTTTISNSTSYATVTGNDSNSTAGLVGGAVLTTNETTYGTLAITDSKSIAQGMNSIGGVHKYASSTYTLLSSYDMSTMLAGVSDVAIRQTATTLQVGTNGNDSCQLTFDINFALDISAIGADISSDSALATIDDFINMLSEQETKLGAVQNRLESALDEISTQYENLVSSRSTIRDADIAEVSSHYIQQQILQQASATLMSTANQSPAIALQLI